MAHETKKTARAHNEPASGGLRRIRSARDILAAANSPVLSTENQADFDCVRDALESEIQPRGIIEELYADDENDAVWEKLRSAVR